MTDKNKIILINKINTINCKKTLNLIYILLKGNNIKYKRDNNFISFDFNKDIDNKLIKYINDLIYNNKSLPENIKCKKPELSYNIEEYYPQKNTINYKINPYKQIKIKKEEKKNSIIYNNIIRLLTY